MKILILIGSLAGILSLNAQTTYVDDEPIAMKYGIKMKANSLHENGDTLYFKMKDERYQNQAVYALKINSTVNDSWMYATNVMDSANHSSIGLITDLGLLHMFSGDNKNFKRVWISSSCTPVKKEPKTELKNFNVNRIMTSNEISFDFYPNVTAYYPWSITNASGREVASGTLYAHTPSESFKITADNLKAGRYTFTIGEGSDSRSENFSIY